MLTRSKHTKILKIAAGLFVAILAIFLLANFALAADFWGGDANKINFQTTTGLGQTDLRVTIARIIRIFIGFLGIIAVVLIIYGGWLWMTSAGDEQRVEQAKTVLKNATIGLIIVLLSFAIVSFILNLLGDATGGGPNNQAGNPPANYGLSALGNGIIQSHYPARGQKEVPRNTSIIITFRELMLASTICAVNNNINISEPCSAGGAAINKDIVRIFKKDQEADCVAGPTPSPLCTSLVEARVYSIDNKTFVFVPINYLGSPSEYIDYTVYLGNDLRRQSGCQVGDLSKCDRAFPGLSGDYGWSFEVSNKIDLIPPQVQNNGVFPRPDNFRDTTVPGVGKQAEGTITVNSDPAVYSDASVSVVKNPNNAPWSNATATVDENCGQSGSFGVKVDDFQASIIRLSDSGGRLLGQGVINGQTVVFSLCNLRLTIDSGNFGTSNLWTVTIRPMVAADTITVGNITYTAISGATGDTNFHVELGSENVTAASIFGVLGSNPEITRTVAGGIVTVKAKIAGLAGNSINLSSTNNANILPSPLLIAPMHDGADKVDMVTVNDKKDQPMNSGLQINFNEAIMPLTVSGTSEEVSGFIRVVNADATAKPTAANPGDLVCTIDADCKSFVCTNGICTGTNNYLEGKFAVSNQYRTVEFLSNKECGFNACGEKIYCLPANSHLKVELNAASLIPCTTNNDCKANSPFNTCDSPPGGRGFCWDGTNYFPQADKTKPNIVDGLVDASFNSLDGNRNGLAYGPESYYNENTPVATAGDSYQWSFFINSLLDLTPPKIKTTTPAINATGVDLANKINISFNKLMLSSRLTTGSLTIRNGQVPVTHYLLNLRSFVDQPLGYWVTSTGQQSVPGSGEIDFTEVYINHSAFNGASTYKAQAGSGLKDIYQNCFLPGDGPACSANPVNLTAPSCCNGTPYASCP